MQLFRIFVVQLSEGIKSIKRSTQKHQQQSSRVLRGDKVFLCEEWGRIAMNCPANAVLRQRGDVFEAEAGEEVTHQGAMDGVQMEILLDKGSTRTLVQQKLVSKGKILLGESVVVQCTHGKSVQYPLTYLDIEVEGNW